MPARAWGFKSPLGHWSDSAPDVRHRRQEPPCLMSIFPARGKTSRSRPIRCPKFGHFNRPSWAAEFRTAVTASGDRWPKGCIPGASWAWRNATVTTLDHVYDNWTERMARHCKAGRLRPVTGRCVARTLRLRVGPARIAAAGPRGHGRVLPRGRHDLRRRHAPRGSLEDDLSGRCGGTIRFLTEPPHPPT